MIEATSIGGIQSATLRSTPQPVASFAASQTSAASTFASQDYVASSIRVDNLQNRAILEYRSSKTGEVVRQFPTEYQIRAFQRAQAAVTTPDEATRETTRQTTGAGDQTASYTTPVAPAASVDTGAAVAVSAPAGGSDTGGSAPASSGVSVVV